MFCTLCGTRNTEEARYCYSCGAPIAVHVAPVQPAPPTPQPEPLAEAALTEVQSGGEAQFSYGALDITPDEPPSPGDVKRRARDRNREEVRGAIHGLGRGLGWWLSIGLIRSGPALSSMSAGHEWLGFLALACIVAAIWLVVVLWRTRGAAREEWTWVGLGIMVWIGFLLAAGGVVAAVMGAFSATGKLSLQLVVMTLMMLGMGAVLLRTGFALARGVASRRPTIL